MTKVTITKGLFAALLLTGGAFAQMNHGGHGGAPSTANSNSPIDLTKLSGRAFDRAYLSMMIGHHQGALDMSRAVVNRVKDATVKTWANAVIADQTREINTMTTWLRGMGGVQANARDAMLRDMRAMVTPLKTARDPNLAFVRGMIPHHASALDMASLALQKSTDDRVLKLSRDIIKAQADEMYAFKTWLAKR